MTSFSLLITVFVPLCFTCCVAIGPMTVTHDRLDYTSAISFLSFTIKASAVP